MLALVSLLNSLQKGLLLELETDGTSKTAEDGASVNEVLLASDMQHQD